MAIDFRVLSETPYTSSVSTMMQLLQMQQQERMQAKQIASSEAQTMFTTQAQQAENQKNRDQSTVGQLLNYQTEQDKLVQKTENDQIKNAIDERQVSAYESQIAQSGRRLDFDIAKEDFDQQMKLTDEGRKNDTHQWNMFDRQQKETVRQALGQAFAQGGYGAAAEVMARAGLPGEAQKLRIQAAQESKIQSDMQNSLLQGQKTIWDIKNEETKFKHLQFGTALSSYINDISATTDPALRQKKLENAAEGIKDFTGSDYSNLLSSEDGQQVFMNTLMRMSNQFQSDLAYKAKDPNRDNQTALGIQAAFKDNPYFDGFAKGWQPQQKGGVTVNNIVPGTDPEGNVVFPGTTATQTDIQKDVRVNQQAIRDLDFIKQNMDTTLLDFSSRVGTKVARISDYLGVSSDSQKERINKVESFLTPVEQFFNTYRKNITGAAASEKELQKLRETFINGDLSPTEFEARYTSLVNKIQNSLNANVNEAEAGGIIVNKGSSNYSNLSDTDLDAELSKYGFQ
jgi:hypothetical protein